jgi:O-antigen ligase
VLVLLVVNLVRTPRHYGALVTAVIGFTAYLAAYALYLDHTGAVITENGYTRILATGIFSDPNDLAATICAGLALTFSRLTTSASTKRFLYSAMAALMLYAIWLTNSRSGLLALGAVALGFLWQLYRTKPRVAIALAVLMLVAFLAVGHGRMTNYDTSDQSANQRFWYWSNGVQLLMASPFFGCGYGQFINMNGGMVAHNSFVQCFAELGYVGYFFWLGLFYYAFKKPASEPAAAPGIVSPPLPNSLPRDHYAVCLGLAAYLVASYWLTHTYNPVLLLLAGLAVCGRTVSDSGAVDWRITPKELRRDVLAIGTIAVVSVAFIARMADYYR